VSIDLGSDDILWPRKGDDPRAIGERSRLVAALNFSHDDPWGPMAEGFKRLPDLGVAAVEETGRGHDHLVYPILFNYRHFIELSLKEIIRSARRLLGKKGSVPETHNLGDLWNAAQPLLMEIEKGSATTYRDVRACLTRFNEMDPTSEGFRYPVKRSGEDALPDDLHNLDLGQVRDVVSRLAIFLDAVATQISVYLEYKAEMVSAFGDYGP
jgi:hypothetical protein